jgi:hypothetical protein
MSAPSIPTVPRAAARLLGALVAVLAVATCSDGVGPDPDPDPTPGTVTYSLAGPPGAAAGAFLVSLPTAEIVGAGTADAASTVVVRSAGDLTYVAVVYRFATQTAAVSIEVPDVAAPPALTLVQVAGPDDVLRPLGGCALVVVP